jgi:hypothetical protein
LVLTGSALLSILPDSARLSGLPGIDSSVNPPRFGAVVYPTAERDLLVTSRGMNNYSPDVLHSVPN